MADKNNKKKGSKNPVINPVKPGATTGTTVVGQDVSIRAKKITAFIASIVLLYIAKQMNAPFLPERIGNYWNDFKEERLELDEEKRMQMRNGASYVFSKDIATMLKNARVDSNDVILMPSTSYLQAAGLDYHVPEPPIFYYFTGVKTTWHGYDMTIMPKWYCRYQNKSFYLDKIQDKKQLDSILAILKPYPTAL
ncbi:hypothetical protein DBR32_00345 [Taibaiella sp. KBW10]|uniref:hypothetical protein n=1 Tax=Taibaiella sp. KBW10 TaxID=2153357 RepID=UPI000F59232C|nr:hypothetical protein [Taibaiella sp. KBW10]RQO32098.1 hypothetical protein DBR32_00345 [Taibaiella sp. KBW10]